MHFNTIEQFGIVFSKNINNLQSWTKLLRQNRKSIFQWKNPSPPKSMLLTKFEAFGNKTQSDSTLILEGKGENLEFEKLSHFLNWLDFQLLSQRVLSRVVASSWARLSTLTNGQALCPILLKVCRNFKEGHPFDLLIQMNWKSNIFKNYIFFSNTDIHRFLWLYSLIECLQNNRIYATSFWFHSKLVVEKAKRPASDELAIPFFLNILHNFF